MYEYKASKYIEDFIYSIVTIREPSTPQPYNIYPDACDYVLFSSKGYHMIIRKSKRTQKILQENEKLILIRLKPHSLYLLENHQFKFHEAIFTLSIKLFETVSILKQEFMIYNNLFRFLEDKYLKKTYFISYLIDSINTTQGEITVKNFSLYTDKNIRTIERAFKSYIGITPKEYVDIIRFQSIIRKKELIIFSSLGYVNKVWITDYSHLYKIFKKYTDLSPKEFLNKKHVRKHIKSIYDIY